MYIPVKRTNKKVIELSVVNNAISVTAHYKATSQDIKNAISSNYCSLLSMLDNKGIGSATQDLFGEQFGVSDFLKAELYAGNTCMLLGQTLPVLPSVDKQTHICDNCVFVNEQAMKNREERLAQLRKFVRKKSSEVLGDEISNYGAELSLCPAKIELKALKDDSWLICSDFSKRIITLDYRVVQLPDVCRKYLIIHAFMHFKSSGHSSEFWRAVEKHVPNYMDVITSLNQYVFLKDI